jgi:hypothetical protein
MSIWKILLGSDIVGDGNEATETNPNNLPWWEKVSHPDPKVREQGHKESEKERERLSRYDQD